MILQNSLYHIYNHTFRATSLTSTSSKVLETELTTIHRIQARYTQNQFRPVYLPLSEQLNLSSSSHGSKWWLLRIQKNKRTPGQKSWVKISFIPQFHPTSIIKQTLFEQTMKVQKYKLFRCILITLSNCLFTIGNLILPMKTESILLKELIHFFLLHQVLAHRKNINETTYRLFALILGTK